MKPKSSSKKKRSDELLNHIVVLPMCQARKNYIHRVLDNVNRDGNGIKTNNNNVNRNKSLLHPNSKANHHHHHRRRSRSESFTSHNGVEDDTTQLYRNVENCKMKSCIMNSKNPRNNKEKKNVIFDEKVNVVMIPKRNEYSSRISKLLWCKGNELKELVHRNTIEFAYEGWNLDGVITEEDFFISYDNGDLIHPVHLTSDVTYK